MLLSHKIYKTVPLPPSPPAIPSKMTRDEGTYRSHFQTSLFKLSSLPLMEALNRVGIGLCTNLFFPPPHSRKLHKANPRSAATCSASKWAERLISDFQFLGDSSSSSAAATLSPALPRLDPPERSLPIPLDFYKLLGAETHFLGDGIRRSYEARVSKPPSFGFSRDTLLSRRQILQAACETLANPSSRREYNQSLVDDQDAAIVTQVPWDKVISIILLHLPRVDITALVILLCDCGLCRFLELCAFCRKLETLS